MNDANTYIPLQSDPTNDLHQDYEDFLLDLCRRELLSSKEMQDLLPPDPKLPHLFGLPKLHKAGMPMRPVVSCKSSIMAPAASLIDRLLQPVVSADKRYVRDTKHALRILHQTEDNLRSSEVPPSDWWLVSYDVVAFYPSVPHQQALEALQEAKELLDLEDHRFELIHQLLKFQLEKSMFRFENQFFHQKIGLPIGSAIGGPVACLTLAVQESRLEKQLTRTDPPLAKVFQQYFRYLDDSFCLFEASSEQEAKRLASGLQQHLNSFPGFQFTSTGAIKRLVVLDLDISITEDRLRIDRYLKPTNKQTYLSTVSDHPESVKRAIAKGIGVRLRRICTHHNDLFKQMVNDAAVLLGRGHKEDWIIQGFAAALLKDRQELLEDRPDPAPTAQPPVRLVTAFDGSNQLPQRFLGVRRSMETSARLPGGHELQNINLQLVFRARPNLRRLLLRHNPHFNQPEDLSGFTKCGSCLACRRTPRQQPLTVEFPPEFKIDGQRIRRRIPTSSCKTTNVVYLAGCIRCGVFYIGQTGRSVGARIAEHSVKSGDVPSGVKPSWGPVRTHLVCEEHLDGLFMSVLEIVRLSDERTREDRENFWIGVFKPTLNVLRPSERGRVLSFGQRSIRSPHGSPVSSPSTSRTNSPVRGVSRFR